MAFDSRAYRILIASPSDVEEERDIAVAVIQAWNDLNAYSRNVVLLPLRWETHTAPEYNTRPQEVINRAIVDDCDLLLGIFWTRFGTPTGVSDSGSLEEIERVAAAGKPVMLYFSKVPSDPYLIDSEQLERLKRFKEKTQQHALIETFRSQIEFRDKFSKQLEMKVRELRKADDSGHGPPLVLQLLGNHHENKYVAKLPEVSDIDTALRADTDAVRKRIEEAVGEAIQQESEVPVYFAITNAGASGIRNLFAKVAVKASSPKVSVAEQSSKMVNSWQFITTTMMHSFNPGFDFYDETKLTKNAEGWHFTFEWDALQPQRTRLIKTALYITATEDAHIEIEAKLYADSFPEPVLLRAAFDILIQRVSVTLLQLLPKLEELRTTSDESSKTSTIRSVKWYG
jgi:hypothetical protein